MIFIDVKNSLFHFAYMKQEGKKKNGKGITRTPYKVK